MTPHDLHIRTQRLEREIADSVRHLVDRYTEATGASPAAIEINTVDITPLGDHRRRYLVGGCRVRIEDLEDPKP